MIWLETGKGTRRLKQKDNKGVNLELLRREDIYREMKKKYGNVEMRKKYKSSHSKGREQENM